MSDEPTKSARNEHVAAIPLARTDPDAVEERTWSGRPVPDGYTGMIDEIHELLDRVAAAAPTTDLVTEATKVVADLNARLAEYAVDEADQVPGRLVTVPGRAQLAVPAVHVEHLDDLGMTGRVRFGRHFLGSGRPRRGDPPALRRPARPPRPDRRQIPVARCGLDSPERSQHPATFARRSGKLLFEQTSTQRPEDRLVPPRRASTSLWQARIEAGLQR